MGRGGPWEATAGDLNEGLRGLRGGGEWVPRGRRVPHGSYRLASCAYEILEKVEP